MSPRHHPCVRHAGMRLAAGLAVATSLAPAAAPGQAALTLSVPLGEGDEVIAARYDCEGETTHVRYVNAGGDAFALVEVGGRERLFVNVVSASGARYVSGRWEWWSARGDARLTDLTDGGGGTECAGLPPG
ncbi:membrane-bound inhibitor of C-type lysozyme [Hasllibacter halocynthiae]|uniref:Membrane-bound inhibitor of C-type lysozyme n=1 Tax=Hasllibacter halocynthiae TaxID=595589 RepID=A0A2T0X1P5_9RHOB|nr:MliC family protein [Hasllibacter halocynthiae]PRY92861.1 membrane-bound inhibitor of C-type lysozyme [Hasllibacter halocynthiae]